MKELRWQLAFDVRCLAVLRDRLKEMLTSPEKVVSSGGQAESVITDEADMKSPGDNDPTGLMVKSPGVDFQAGTEVQSPRVDDPAADDPEVYKLDTDSPGADV